MKVILTGATGMVGRGVLLECLDSPEVGKVLAVNRQPLGLSHPKLEEILHGDFSDLAPVEGGTRRPPKLNPGRGSAL